MLPTAASGRPPRTPFLDNFLFADHTLRIIASASHSSRVRSELQAAQAGRL